MRWRVSDPRLFPRPREGRDEHVVCVARSMLATLHRRATRHRHSHTPTDDMPTGEVSRSTPIPHACRSAACAARPACAAPPRTAARCPTRRRTARICHLGGCCGCRGCRVLRRCRPRASQGAGGRKLIPSMACPRPTTATPRWASARRAWAGTCLSRWQGVTSGSPPLTTAGNYQRPDRALGTCTRRLRGERWARRGRSQDARSCVAGRAPPMTRVGRQREHHPRRPREAANSTTTRHKRDATSSRLHFRRALHRILLDA